MGLIRASHLLVAGLTALCAAEAWAQDGKPPVNWIPANPAHQSSRRGERIHYVILHTIEGSASSGINTFRYDTRRVSAHYIVAKDGAITQMVRDDRNAWHAGNSLYNRRSIGIEHGGYADRNQWTMEQYRASARLTRWLCDTYGIPKDRRHIIGHDEVPGATHHDPGRFFDWDLYMGLVRGGSAATAAEAPSETEAPTRERSSDGGGSPASDDRPSPTAASPDGALAVTPMSPAPDQTVGLLNVRWREQTADGFPGLALSWSIEGRARAARVQVGEPGGSLRYDSEWLQGAPTAHRLPVRLQHGKTYRWRVGVWDGERTVVSRWVPFQADFTPPRIEAVWPEDGAKIHATPVLRWRYEDPDGKPQASYRVWVDDDADHSTTFLDTKELNGETAHYYLQSRLRPDRTYYWRVMGYDGQGNPALSGWRRFQTSPEFQDNLGEGLSVRAIAPHDAARLPRDVRPVLRWAYNSRAQRDQEAFRIQLDDDADPASLLVDEVYRNNFVRAYRARPLEPGVYRWRVRVWDGQDSAWSEWSSFVLGDVGPAVGAADIVAGRDIDHGAPEEAGGPSGARPAGEATALPAGAPRAGADPSPSAPGSFRESAPGSLRESAPAGIALPDDRSTSDAGGGSTPGWLRYHAGVELEGAPIPRRGLANPTLRLVLGQAVEPQGEVVELGGRRFVGGKCSWFGGPVDQHLSPNERTGLTMERLAALNSPLNPSAAEARRRAEDYYFVSMRWDYTPNGKPWWARQRILVVNPENGRAVVLRVVDWGPHTRVNRTVDVSHQALKDLGATTDDELLVAFAPADAPLGPVR